MYASIFELFDGVPSVCARESFGMGSSFGLGPHPPCLPPHSAVGSAHVEVDRRPLFELELDVRRNLLFLAGGLVNFLFDLLLLPWVGFGGFAFLLGSSFP